LRKIILLMSFLALCMTLYSLSGVYAAVNTLPAVPNNLKQSTVTAVGYANSSLALNLRACGDPIEDPRPR
jgi:hypothetical protein